MDKEEIIRRLKKISRHAVHVVGEPPFIMSLDDGIALDYAVQLLEEQESVVHPEPSCEMTYITDCCCDLCGAQLIQEDNFCRCCGKRIEWEGR